MALEPVDKGIGGGGGRDYNKEERKAMLLAEAEGETGLDSGEDP